MDKAKLEEIGLQAAQGIGGGILNAGLGLMTANWADRRQLRQQRKLQELQMAGQLKMWEQTNYSAQRAQMEKAGLNPGLMYGMSGAGGATTGNITGGQAPTGGGELAGMGVLTAAQLKMMQAQIENIQADTQLKLKGVPKVGAEEENIRQNTKNAITDGIIKDLEAKLLQVQYAVQSESIDELKRLIIAQMEEAEAKARQADTMAKLGEQGFTDTLKQIKQTTVEQAGRIALQKAQVNATEAQIKKATADIWQIYNNANNENRRISQADAQIMLQKIQTEFATGTPQQIKQIVDIWRTILDGIVNAVK